VQGADRRRRERAALVQPTTPVTQVVPVRCGDRSSSPGRHSSAPTHHDFADPCGRISEDHSSTRIRRALPGSLYRARSRQEIRRRSIIDGLTNQYETCSLKPQIKRRSQPFGTRHPTGYLRLPARRFIVGARRRCLTPVGGRHATGRPHIRIRTRRPNSDLTRDRPWIGDRWPGRRHPAFAPAVLSILFPRG
jgi:hypothetical protein